MQLFERVPSSWTNRISSEKNGWAKDPLNSRTAPETSSLRKSHEISMPSNEVGVKARAQRVSILPNQFFTCCFWGIVWSNAVQNPPGCCSTAVVVDVLVGSVEAFLPFSPSARNVMTGGTIPCGASQRNNLMGFRVNVHIDHHWSTADSCKFPLFQWNSMGIRTFYSPSRTVRVRAAPAQARQHPTP
jgi:hypothetical protein